MNLHSLQTSNRNSLWQEGFFKDRAEAGRKLAEFFDHMSGKNAVVYALPRGGVVIGREIAKAINAPLDLIITRKIGHPIYPEYAIGAVAENGDRILNEDELVNIPEEYLKKETEKERKEAKRRREAYLEGRQPIPCKDKTAILVDDGIATGLTMKTAIKELQLHFAPLEIIVAVPVAPKETVVEMEKDGIKVLCILTTKEFLGSIGAYYHDFSPVEDEDVKRILKELFKKYEQNRYT